jgi:hypothetical protein
MLRRKENLCQRRLGACSYLCTDIKVRWHAFRRVVGRLICVRFTDSSDFLRKHPWPGRSIADTFDDSTHRTGKLSKRFLSDLKIVCGKTGREDDLNDWEDPEEERVLYDASEDDASSYPFYWSSVLQQSFREELEKFVLSPYCCLAFNPC